MVISSDFVIEKNIMRVLIAGDWHSSIHEEQLACGLRHHGVEVFEFKWFNYFCPVSKLNLAEDFLKRLQNKIYSGPIVNRVNTDLISCISDIKPDFVILYRSTHIYASSIIKIKKIFKNIKILLLNNDNCFAKSYPWWFWRHYRRSVPLADAILSYRRSTVVDYYNLGAKQVIYFPPWFVPEVHKVQNPLGQDEAGDACDVIFIGHYEDDGRDLIIENIIRAGYSVKVFGPPHGWERVFSQSKILKDLLPVYPLLGSEYNTALNKAKIALCFFSKLNEDTFTRRCFEIPASGTVLLSESSYELSNIFVNGEEVFLFKSSSECLNMVKYLLDNDGIRSQVSLRGQRRVWIDGYDLYSRCSDLFNFMNNII